MVTQAGPQEYDVDCISDGTFKSVTLLSLKTSLFIGHVSGLMKLTIILIKFHMLQNNMLERQPCLFR